MAKKKTLLVGFDAACWGYLNPLLAADALPNLQRLMKSGTWGTLQSTMPAWTPTAWSSIVTGKNPGKHGIYDMLVRRPGTHDFVPASARLRNGRSFWQRLNEQGLRVGLVNIPFTYPAQPMDGFLICGFGTPNSVADFAYPEPVLAEIKAQRPNFRPVVDADVLMSQQPERIFQVERDLQTSQVQLALEYAVKHDVDVLAINLMLLDHANHKMPEMEQVNRAIIETDRDLGLLLAEFAPDNVMVISDHGASRIKGVFLLQAWLREQGYFVQAARSPESQADVLNWVHVQWLREHLGLPRWLELIMRRAANTLVPRLPAGLAQRYWQYLEQIIPFAKAQVHFDDMPDFEQTQLFPGTVHSGLLYLNISNGTERGKQQALLAELAAKLRQLVDPETGKSLFAHVYTKDQIFSGAAAAHGPDLVIDNYGSAWNVQLSSYTGVVQPMPHRYFLPGLDYGWHSRDGIFVFDGLDFAQGQADTEAELVDLPAILLYLHGVPIPEDFDGRVLTDLIAPEFLDRHPIQYQKGEEESDLELETDMPYTPEESTELVEHLRALGYME